MADRNQPVQQQQDNRERTPSVRPKLIVGVAKGSFFFLSLQQPASRYGWMEPWE
jgi:hypothetical protein